MTFIDITTFGSMFPEAIGSDTNKYYDIGNGWELAPKTEYQLAYEELEKYIGAKT